MSNVAHPQHYGGDTPHEVIKCLKAWGMFDNALRFNSIKYLSRAGRKNDIVEDLEKAIFYIQEEIKDIKQKRVAFEATKEPFTSTETRA